MAFDTNSALQAGYSQDEINQYLQQKNNSVMGGGIVGQVAHNVTNAIPDWLGGNYVKSLLGAGYEGSRALGQAAGIKNLYINQQGKAIEDPFLSQEELGNYDKNLPTLAKTTANNVMSGESVPLLASSGLSLTKGIAGILKGNASKLADAGNGIRNTIIQAENMPNKQNIIDSLLEKHFGTYDDPNTDLIPNAPAQEQNMLKTTLKKEIIAQGRGKLGSTNFGDIQNWKSGAGAAGKFANNTTSATQQLFQNISRAYGNTMREAIPNIGKYYDDYSKATQALSQHGGGVMGALKGIQSQPLARVAEVLGTGYAGYKGLAYLLRSPISALLNTSNSNWNNPQVPGSSNNGW